MDLKTIYRWMALLIESAEGDYESIWDEFWKLSKRVRVRVDWCDPDTSYEEDIMARFNAIGNYLEEVNNEQHN